MSEIAATSHFKEKITIVKSLLFPELSYVIQSLIQNMGYLL